MLHASGCICQLLETIWKHFLNKFYFFIAFRMSKKSGGAVDKKEEISSLYKDLAALRPTEDFDPSPEDYEKAVKICNKILNLDSNDVTAFHCKVVALIQVTIRAIIN